MLGFLSLSDDGKPNQSVGRFIWILPQERHDVIFGDLRRSCRDLLIYSRLLHPAFYSDPISIFRARSARL